MPQSPDAAFGNRSKIPAAAERTRPIKPLGLLVGEAEICDYLRVARTTLKRWRSHHGLPICYLPNGNIGITVTMIDAWLIERVPSQPVNGRWNRTRRIKAEQRERAEQAA